MSCISSYLRLSDNICISISVQCSMIVVCPTVSPLIRPVTYGRLDIGDVPRAALMEKATPNAIINSPTNSMPYLLSLITHYGIIYSSDCRLIVNLIYSYDNVDLCRALIDHLDIDTCIRETSHNTCRCSS